MNVPQAMPHSKVLCYLTPNGVSTPTRVQIVAAAAMRWLALAPVLTGGTLMYFALRDIREHANYFGICYWQCFKEGLQNWDSSVWMALVALVILAITVPFWALAPYVERGHRPLCGVAYAFMIPVIIIVVLIALSTVSAGILMPIDAVTQLKSSTVMENSRLLLSIILFVAGGVFIFLVLLSKDVMGYLLWIARCPSAEKPAVKFLG